MKISYLIGAGASCNSLPLVTQIPNRIKQVIDLLNENKLKLSNNSIFAGSGVELTQNEVQKNLIKDLEWLLVNSKNHASIDTFAKKLWLKRQYDDLNRLKNSFSVYFMIEHFINPVDKRYDSFFASILGESITDLPENLRILSWNYDYQFEKAFSEYSQHKSIEVNKSFLNTFTKYSHKSDNGKFSIVKLNGSANLLSNKGMRIHEYIDSLNDEISTTELKQIIDSYARIQLKNDTNLFPGLSFAWEKYYEESNNIIKKAINTSYDTEVLVVIGYSFPYFNRSVDREVIQSMKNLKKVYFQAPDAQNLKEKFLAIRTDIETSNLINIFDTNQFFLPNEL